MRSALLALVLLSGCSSIDCTLVGCVNGLYVTGASAGAQACLDDVCTALDGDGGARGRFAPFGDVHEGYAKHVLTVDGVRYEGPVTFEKLQPNGPKCAPRCYHAAFALTDGKLEPQPG
jgi:hypothetical protein